MLETLRRLMRPKQRTDAECRAILDKAANLRLSENTGFESRVAEAEKIDGMFSRFSMAVIDMLLDLQAAQNTGGDMLEIGTYKGRSAALLASRLNQGERLTLVDIADYLDRVNLSSVSDRIDSVFAPSQKLRRALPRYSARRGTFRFIHIDASHGYRETFTELGMADELLKSGGIIAMDDFSNLNYSQNVAAIFRYLFTTTTRLTMLLVTDEKAYLCKREDRADLARMILERSLAELQSRGIDACLARTETSKGYRAFYLRRRAPDEGQFYGPELYAPAIAGVD